MIVKINTEYIKLNQFLKLAGVIVNGGEAKEMIQNKLIMVNGQHEFARGKKLFSGDRVKIEGVEYIVERE